MNLNDASRLATEKMAEHGLLPVWRFKFNHRRRGFGLCSFKDKTIYLSAPLVNAATLGDTLDTILHEIAHALCGPEAGHGPKWVATAKSIGCNGQRCYNEGTKSAVVEASHAMAKYVGTCPSGHKSYAHRVPTNRKSCARCCPGHFDERYLINWAIQATGKPVEIVIKPRRHRRQRVVLFDFLLP